MPQCLEQPQLEQLLPGSVRFIASLNSVAARVLDRVADVLRCREVEHSESTTSVSAHSSLGGLLLRTIGASGAAGVFHEHEGGAKRGALGAPPGGALALRVCAIERAAVFTAAVRWP